MKLPSLKLVNLSPEFVFVLVAFIAVIFVANYGCCSGVQAFEPNTLFPNYSTFEAFDGHTKEDTDKHSSTTETLTNKDKKEDKNVISEKLQQIKNLAAELISKPKNDNTIIDGFSNMSPSDIGNAYGVIDIVGKLTASAECIGKSHGYSKSTGGICWDKETENLLLSRGGQGICRGKI
jgi:hypothetical protein